MSDILQALVKRTSVFIIIIGVLLLAIGASGEIVLGTFSYMLSNPIAQWLIIVVSILLIVVGLFIEIKDSNLGPTIAGNDFGLFTSDADVSPHLELKKRIELANSIELLGYNLKSLLQDLREPLANAIIRGASVRVVLVDITNQFTNELFEHHTNRPHLMLPDWVTAYEHLRDIQKLLDAAPKINGKFEVRLTSWVPSCNLIMFDSDDANGLVKVGIHSVIFRQPLAHRLSLLLTRKNNSKAFEFFSNGFDTLWDNDTKEWNKEIPPLTHVDA